VPGHSPKHIRPLSERPLPPRRERLIRCPDALIHGIRAQSIN